MNYEKEFREFANDVFNCDKKCDRVRCDRERGIVPRYFAISPPLDNRGKIDAIICGKNPGRTPMGEGLWWKSIIARNGDIYEAYNEYVNFGRDFPDIYFHLPYEAVKEHELKRTKRPVIYFTNIAKCENANGTINIRTLRKCRDIYLDKELEILLEGNLVNSNTPVFFLGVEAFSNGDEFFKTRGFVNVSPRPKPHPCRGYSLKKGKSHKKDYNDDWSKGCP